MTAKRKKHKTIRRGIPPYFFSEYMQKQTYFVYAIIIKGLK